MNEQIDGLEEKIIGAGELPGILNWSLAGLDRLLKNKKFTGSKTSTERGIEYDMKSNPLSYFVRDVTEEDRGNGVLQGDLYAAYTRYAKENELPQLTKKEIKAQFIRECKEVGIDTEFKQKRFKTVNSSGVEVSQKGRGFMNIKLKEAVESHTKTCIEAPEEHDREERKRGMMKDLNNYLKSEQKINGGIVDPEDTAAGFLVRFPGYKEITDLEEITGYTMKVKEGFSLPN